jgi:hypothetical protein
MYSTRGQGNNIGRRSDMDGQFQQAKQISKVQFKDRMTYVYLTCLPGRT